MVTPFCSRATSNMLHPEASALLKVNGFKASGFSPRYHKSKMN